MIKPLVIVVCADLPRDLGGAFLQYIRDFDVHHPGCHFQINGLAPDHSTDEIAQMLRDVEPPFTEGIKVVRRP